MSDLSVPGNDVDDAALAGRLARSAGELLISLRATGLVTAAALGRAGDRAANALIVETLRQHRPDDGLLSEEEKADDARLSQARVWIVDPLDGTREYSEGRDDWAVHIGLSVEGVAVVGAVALPALGSVLVSDGVQSARVPARAPQIVVSRSRPPAEGEAVAVALDGELVPMGSAGAKAMAVVTGAADIYVHSGGQYEWDSCAPVAVARAASLHVSRLDGSPLRYNRAGPYLPDLLICRPEYVSPVLSALTTPA